MRGAFCRSQSRGIDLVVFSSCESDVIESSRPRVVYSGHCGMLLLSRSLFGKVRRLPITRLNVTLTPKQVSGRRDTGHAPLAPAASVMMQLTASRSPDSSRFPAIPRLILRLTVSHPTSHHNFTCLRAICLRIQRPSISVPLHLMVHGSLMNG